MKDLREIKSDNRIKLRLRTKIILLLVALTVCLTGGMAIVGARNYENSIIEKYNSIAYMGAYTTAGYFDEGELKAYADLLERYKAGENVQAEIDEVVSSRRYQQIKGLVVDLRKNLGANGIYICVVDQKILDAYTPEARAAGTWNPISYIMDCYRVEGEDMKFGDKSGVLPEFIEDFSQMLRTGHQPEDKIISDSDIWGWNITAIIPVVQDGQVYATIGVEIPMETLLSDVFKFVRDLGIIALMILVFALVFAGFLTMDMIVRPIQLVANEANHFVSKEANVSDRLGLIKTKDEIQMLAESLLTMELSINDYIENIQRITAERERIGAELNVATNIQASMLPTDFDAYSSHTEFKLYATMDPAKEVGGDFYDFFLIDDTHIGLVMADVSGKGVPAALFMVKAKTSIKTRALAGGTPSDILADVNDMLCEGNEAELFVTVWMAIVDLETGKGLAANAGHEHPALCHADGEFELIKYRHGPAVATMEGLPFREHEFELLPGDTLYVYTDGVTEATSASNELFGEERLTTALNHDPKAEPDVLLRTVREDIDEFVGDAPQFDDVTMLAFRYFGKQ